MKLFSGLVVLFVLSACANNADVHLKIDMPPYVDEFVAKKIVLSWVLKNGEYDIPTKYWVNETRKQYSRECWEPFANEDGSCVSKYFISILNKDTECISKMHSVFENCSSEKCVYSFGPEIGEILCW